MTTHGDSPAELSPHTRAVHSGRPEHVADAPLNEPITMASTYVGDGERGYGRYGNPTWSAFEDALGDLEGGTCLAFGSGMAAASTLLGLVATGDKVVLPRHCYLGVLAYAADLESRGHLTTQLVDIDDTDQVIAAIDDDTALLWLESPTNPAMEVADLPRLIAAAHERGARVVVDNTFYTPILQRPLDDGADMVMHSATKFISGHSDSMLGAVITRDEQILTALKQRRDVAGAVPGTFEAWLGLRGLRTLPLRIERAQATARVLAERLADHPAIERVRYPGAGGVLSIEVAGGAVPAEALTHGTRLWVHTTSLGGVESTFERRRRWDGESSTIPENLVRMSVGIEDAEDLWADLKAVLDRLGGEA